MATQKPSCLLFVFIFAFVPCHLVTAGEWPQWRGPNRDGVSDETGLLKQWDKNGPPLAFRTRGLGAGFSGVSVAEGKIFTMGELADGQHVIALNLADGKKLWSTKIDGRQKHSKQGPRCTPSIDGELTYALSSGGVLACLETATGKLKWTKSSKKDFGGRMMSGWGFSESPLVDDEKIVFTPGSNDAMIVALNKTTGKEIWRCKVPKLGSRGKDGTAYSSIVISNGGGVKQYVQLVGRGLIGVRASDGKFLWAYNRVANGTANITTPIVQGDYVFGSSGYNTGTVLLKLSANSGGVKAEEVYFLNAKTFQNHHGGLVLIGDYLYGGHGHNKGEPACLEMKTGKILWKKRALGQRSSAYVYADGHLYIRYEKGLVALIEANPRELKVKGTFKIPDNKSPSWPHPVISGGKLYLRDQDSLFCYNVKAG